jgi:hypothetical protein
MKAAPLRLVLAVVLFIAWVSWLGWLALPTTTPREVLSRAQFLASQYDVIAQVDADPEGRPLPRVKVEGVTWPKEEAGNLLGPVIDVANLDQCKGWDRPGVYILPLVKDGDHYRVATVPRSPGYEGASRRYPRIYPATEQNRRQLAAIPKPGAG